jgi:rubrerythrin
VNRPRPGFQEKFQSDGRREDPVEKKIKAIIQQAIDDTMSSRELYLTMADLVERPETKETLRYLAKNETGHKRFLERILDEVVCPLEPPIGDTHVSEFLKCPPITRKLSPKEALVIAIKREETLHKFYKYLEDIQPPGEIRDLLQEMALIKLEHREKLEDIYDNLTFPEVW